MNTYGNTQTWRGLWVYHPIEDVVKRIFKDYGKTLTALSNPTEKENL